MESKGVSMRKILQTLTMSALFCFCAMPVSAASMQNDAWEIDTEHSSVGFRVRHISGFVSGFFTKYSGQVNLDPVRPEKGQFYILVDSASVHTGLPKRDEQLKSEIFLDVTKSPRIIFSSRQIIREDAGAYVVIGDLTIKDVTAEVRVPLTLLGVKEHPLKELMPNTKVLGLQAEFPIKREDFHVGNAKWTQMGVMGDTILISVNMELLQRK